MIICYTSLYNIICIKLFKNISLLFLIFMYYDDFLVWNLKSYKLKNKRLLEIVVLDGLIITKKK